MLRKHLDSGIFQDYDLVLDTKFGKEGTPERAAFEDKARDFYTAQTIASSRPMERTASNMAASRSSDGFFAPLIY